jgi:error-prone DNA polymerase
LREKHGEKPVALYTIPTDDTQTYDMIGKADTIGVFQIESRAQMSMLPRLRPRCYYDLVIEVAIVRPGPIHGDMVHPYLRRRFGKERVTFPDENVKAILGKTLGVPLFQEQAMRLAICLAGFSPGEAEQLRRAMAAWKRHEDVIQKFKARIIEGMLAHGYSRQFAETCMHQIRGFSEYGFPESHAASFALLVLASAWIKKHYPAQFCASLLNSQPMGFYAPAQIIQDAKNHGVVVESVDINKSDWETTIEDSGAVRIGMHLIKGIEQRQGELIALIVKTRGFLPTIQDLWNAAYETASFIPLRRETLVKLAQADAFQSMGLSRREALWEIRGLTAHPIPLKELDDPIGRSRLPLLSFGQQVSLDYESVGFSAKAHPISLIRPILNKDFNARSWQSIAQDNSLRHGATFTVAGLVISRQRPDTAKGIVFLSLEDETGITNIIVSRELFEQNARAVMHEPALVVRGALRRIGPVVYCVGASVSGIGQLLDEVMG